MLYPCEKLIVFPVPIDFFIVEYHQSISIYINIFLGTSATPAILFCFVLRKCLHLFAADFESFTLSPTPQCKDLTSQTTLPLEMRLISRC